MADRLKGKLAFCTASSAGIGKATAIAFARRGTGPRNRPHEEPQTEECWRLDCVSLLARCRSHRGAGKMVGP